MQTTIAIIWPFFWLFVDLSLLMPTTTTKQRLSDDPPPGSNYPTLTLLEVCTLLRLSKSTVYRVLLHTGRLVAYCIGFGNKLYFYEQDVQQIMKEQKAIHEKKFVKSKEESNT